MKRRYLALQDFFLGYFHPDWQLDAASRGAVVTAFLGAESPARVAAVATDLRELLAEKVEESELHNVLLKEYSLFYDPWTDELTMTEWLEGLLKEVEAASSAD